MARRVRKPYDIVLNELILSIGAIISVLNFIENLLRYILSLQVFLVIKPSFINEFLIPIGFCKYKSVRHILI